MDNYLDVGRCAPDDLVSYDGDRSARMEALDGYSIQSCHGPEANAESQNGVFYAHVYPNLFISRYG